MLRAEKARCREFRFRVVRLSHVGILQSRSTRSMRVNCGNRDIRPSRLSGDDLLSAAEAAHRMILSRSATRFEAANLDCFQRVANSFPGASVAQPPPLLARRCDQFRAVLRLLVFPNLRVFRHIPATVAGYVERNHSARTASPSTRWRNLSLMTISLKVLEAVVTKASSVEILGIFWCAPHATKMKVCWCAAIKIL